MGRIVGIDLGTTNSLVATVDSGIPLVIAGRDGKRLTPSVVYIAGPNQAVYVGEPASRQRAIKPADTFYSVKRFIGRRASEIPPAERNVAYAVNGEGAGPITFSAGARDWTPEEISAEVLKKLKADAEAYFNETVDRAVVTVPAYFNDAQRNATKRAGELAGLTVERIINEPTAAALAYGLDKLKDRSHIAVYDLGGGTFDLSILELHEGVFQVLSTNGNTLLGGDDLDRRLTEFLLKTAGVSPHFLHSRSADQLKPDELALIARVREAAEKAKIDLSSQTEVEINLPFLWANSSFSCKLTRGTLEELTHDIILRTRPHCLRALADAKLEPRDLDQVILVGGQTRMPLVRQLVREWFQCTDFEETRGTVRLGSDYHRASGPELNTSQNPDEAIALGAAIQAEILSGGFKNILLLDVTPLSLGIETFGGLMNVIIPRNSTIPVKAGEMFTTAVDGQREMLIQVLQGERERAKDNWSLGKFTVDFESGPRGTARVGVQFEIDANGILHVLARDTRTGKERVVEMRSAVDVDDSAVQQMVEESVEHAFEDLGLRRWVEAKLKAEQLLPAARKALEASASDFDSEYLNSVRAAIAAVEAELKKTPEDKSGDLARLQASCAELDERTKPMAELLMDRAMEALLRKRGVIQ